MKNKGFASSGLLVDALTRSYLSAQEAEEAEKVEVKSNLTVLNITDKEASPEEIKKAYLTMVKKYHPDLTPTGATPEEREAREERFKEVTRAYDSLKEGVMFEQ